MQPPTKEQLHGLLEIAVREHRYRDASHLLNELVESDDFSDVSAATPDKADAVIRPTTRKFVTTGGPEHEAEDRRRLKR